MKSEIEKLNRCRGEMIFPTEIITNPKSYSTLKKRSMTVSTGWCTRTVVDLPQNIREARAAHPLYVHGDEDLRLSLHGMARPSAYKKLSKVVEKYTSLDAPCLQPSVIADCVEDSRRTQVHTLARDELYNYSMISLQRLQNLHDGCLDTIEGFGFTFEKDSLDYMIRVSESLLVGGGSMNVLKDYYYLNEISHLKYLHRGIIEHRLASLYQLREQKNAIYRFEHPSFKSSTGMPKQLTAMDTVLTNTWGIGIYNATAVTIYKDEQSKLIAKLKAGI